MEFQDLHNHLSESERASLASLGREQAEARVRALEGAWPDRSKKLREKLLAAIGLPEGQRAQQTGDCLRALGEETGCLCGARFLRAHWSGQGAPLPSAQGAGAVESGFAECVSMAATALEACAPQKNRLPTPDYRQLQSTVRQYEATQKSTLLGTFFPPALFAAVWVLLIRWIGTPGFAAFVAKPVWEEVSYAAFVVLFFVFAFGVAAVGGGLIGGAVGGVVLDILAMLFSVYVFGPLIAKLVPPLENVASAYVYLLVFFAALVLILLTLFCGLVPLLNGLGSVGKKGRLRGLRKKLARQLAALAGERRLYGELVDMSVICEAKLRWEGASYAGLPRKEASYQKLRSVRGFFRELCQCFDRAEAYAAEDASG